MQYIDVFNGDADGLCALQQLRLKTPVISTLVTGIKRDISLLKKVDAGAGGHIAVLDSGCVVDYIDHPNLIAMLDTEASTCTNLLVNQMLGNQYPPLWAAVGAFGDNLYGSAQLITQQRLLSEQQPEQLCRLGSHLNYNGYGSVLPDLFCLPDELYLVMRPYEDPFDSIASEEVFNRLQDGFQGDTEKAEVLIPFRNL